MQTKVTAVKKNKRGTIGHAIDELVQKRGQGSNGIYIMEQALLKTCFPTATSAQVYIKHGGVFYSINETPGVKAIREEECRIIAQVIAEIEAQKAVAA